MGRLVIRCEGKARERGFTHGSQARELVRRNVEVYRRLLGRRFDMGWGEARRRTARFVRAIEQYDAELAEELRGIAEGAEVDFEDVVVLNARSSFTLTRPVADCTAVARLPAGDDPDTLLAQNWDNMRGLGAVVLDVAQPGKPACLTLTEAGTLGKIGLNSEGIGLCVNGLHAPGSARGAVPIFVLIRKVLQAGSLVDAMRVITATPRDAPHNYLLASARGAAFAIEALTRDFEVVPASGRLLLHTNHFLARRFADREDLRPGDPDTIVRLWRAEGIANAHAGRFGLAEVKGLLGDHFDGPDSICRHGASGGDDLEGETKCAVIMELAGGRMHVSEGTPCNSPFETFGCR